MPMFSETVSVPLPGLPAVNPTLSIWQRTTRNFEYLNHGATDSIPSQADVVIIGSGLAGSLTAYHLLASADKPENIVMLEAREACSGATGRNAGHCRPGVLSRCFPSAMVHSLFVWRHMHSLDAFRGFTAFSKIHGPEQAMKILKHESLVLDKVADFIVSNSVDCDFDLCGTFGMSKTSAIFISLSGAHKQPDVCMGEDFLQYATTAFEEFKTAGGDTSHIRWMEAEEAQKVCVAHRLWDRLDDRSILLGHACVICIGCLRVDSCKPSSREAVSIHYQKQCQEWTPALHSYSCYCCDQRWNAERGMGGEDSSWKVNIAFPNPFDAYFVLCATVVVSSPLE